jgi:hypothetical protein
MWGLLLAVTQLLISGNRTLTRRGVFYPKLTTGDAMADKPTHELIMVADAKKEGGKARFTRVAALWPSKSDNGLTGEIPEGISVTGRFVILPLKAGADAEG